MTKIGNNPIFSGAIGITTGAVLHVDDPSIRYCDCPTLVHPDIADKLGERLGMCRRCGGKPPTGQWISAEATRAWSRRAFAEAVRTSAAFKLAFDPDKYATIDIDTTPDEAA